MTFFFLSKKKDNRNPFLRYYEARENMPRVNVVSRKSSSNVSNAFVNRRISFMIVAISTLHILGNVPFCLIVLTLSFTSLNSTFLTVSVILIYLSHGMSIFVYYGADKNYKTALKSFFFFSRHD